jgi:hypothetical protein
VLTHAGRLAQLIKRFGPVANCGSLTPFTHFDLNIASIHFYHNMVFVYRGRNDAESNVMRANVPPDWLL